MLPVSSDSIAILIRWIFSWWSCIGSTQSMDLIENTAIFVSSVMDPCSLFPRNVQWLRLFGHSTKLIAMLQSSQYVDVRGFYKAITDDPGPSGILFGIWWAVQEPINKKGVVELCPSPEFMNELPPDPLGWWRTSWSARMVEERRCKEWVTSWSARMVEECRCKEWSFFDWQKTSSQLILKTVNGEARKLIRSSFANISETIPNILIIDNQTDEWRIWYR